MKNINILKVLILPLTLISFAACSPNIGVQKYNIDQAMTGMPANVKGELGDFKFYFGESGPFTAKKLGPVDTVRRTNAWGKTALESCNWVFYSALIALKDQAQKMGGNGVANIQSDWKHEPFSDKNQFVADNGFLMSGIALTGEAIKE